MDQSEDPGTNASIGSAMFTQGPDHARLSHAAKVALGSALIIVFVIVAAVGLWRQAQAERKAVHGRCLAARPGPCHPPGGYG